MPSPSGRDANAPQHSLATRQPSNQVPAVSRAAQVAQHQAKPSPLSTANRTKATARRRWSPMVRVFVDLCSCAGLIVGVLSLMVAFGQTQLVATLVVGAILVVVFGTPLLCVVGVVGFYIWAMTRVHRDRRHYSTQPTAHPSSTQAVAVTGVIFDE